MGTCATRDIVSRKSTDRTSSYCPNPAIIQSIQKNLICEICNNSFDHHERCPMMLCSNQHNACKQCLDSFKSNQCPFCRLQISRAKIAKNRMLLEMIQQPSPKMRQTQQIVLFGKDSTNESKEALNDRADERKESVWWNIVSDHKPENKQLINQTLSNAKKHRYEQVVYWILMALKRPISSTKKILLKSLICQSSKAYRYYGWIHHFRNGLKGFGNLPKLRTLELRSRHTKQIYYLGLLPALQVLDMSYNQIEMIQNLDQFSKLKHLNLNNNKIKTIEKLDKLLQLQCLKLSFNKIERIQNLDDLTNLRELYLDNNIIKEINNLECLSELQVLSLIDNKISVMENLHQLSKLKKVAVAGNPIDHETCQMEIRALKDMFEIDLFK